MTNAPLTQDPAGFSAEIPADIAAALGDAEAPYSRPDAAERTLLAALDQAPDNPGVRIALYTFYFYTHRLEAAIPHGEACLAMAARVLGVPEDWRQVGPDSADFNAFDRPQRLYLKSLVAVGYCRARLGDVVGGEDMIRKAASLDPEDRVGAARLADLVARGGTDEDEDEDD